MFKSSEVLTYMNDEAINTDEGGEMQSDSSFMQKYTRSNMMTTEELERIDELTSDGIGDESSYGSIEEPDDLPALWKCEMKEQSTHIEQMSTKVDFKSSTVDEKLHCQPAIESPVEPAIAISEPKKNYLESQEELKQQVSNIQDQIRKLSSLPSIIQTAINDIAAQISGLIPVIQEGHIQTIDNHDSIPCDNTENQKNDIQELQLASQYEKTTTASECQSHILTVDSHDSRPCEHTENQKNDIQELQLASQYDKTITESECQVSNGESRKESLASQIIVESNHQEQVRKCEEKARCLRSLEACKTPRERPLVLPGGRKWYNPKDAFNEESIAEIISSQAELINGSTLGKFESPFLGYDDRINFQKYKKPEKDLSNLARSEVYKLIHNMDTQSTTSISERATKTHAAKDVVHYFDI